jgi:hypothetical protein
MLFLALLVQLCSSDNYSWDPSTKYAHFYKINGAIATQNDPTTSVPYLLKTK